MQIVQRFIKILLAGVACSLALSCEVSCSKVQDPQSERKAQPMILDMDLGSSTDDVVCMDLMLKSHIDGKINLLGIVCDRMGDSNAIVADIFRTYYGLPDIPIGLERNGVENPHVFINYSPLLDTLGLSSGHRVFERQVSDCSLLPDAYKLYRKLLSEAEDHSVTIISTGFLTSISNLLTSPSDEFSDLSGTLLVARKVKELIIMAGQFSDTREPDYNMNQASSWAETFVRLWPAEVPVTYNPMEVGEALYYSRQQVLEDFDAIEVHPLKAIYQDFTDEDTGQRMWDPVCFLYAVEDKSLFNVSSPGYVVIDVADFTMDFHPDENFNQHYLKPFTEGNAEKVMNIIRTGCSRRITGR